jgi:hypothetical protein
VDIHSISRVIDGRLGMDTQHHAGCLVEHLETTAESDRFDGPCGDGQIADLVAELRERRSRRTAKAQP